MIDRKVAELATLRKRDFMQSKMRKIPLLKAKYFFRESVYEHDTELQ